jgi:hypothetical protein
VQIVTTPPPDRQIMAIAIRTKSKKGIRNMRILGVLFVLLGVAEYFADQFPFAVALVVIGVLFTLVLPPVQVNQAVTRSWQMYGSPATYMISDGGLQRTDQFTSHGYAWPALIGLDVLPDVLVFSLSKIAMMPVPTTAMAPGERELVLALAAQHGVPVQMHG